MSEPLRAQIVILGTGIAGTILGAILARQGVDVLMLERHAHPRFAIGESTTPETSMWLRILAARFGVPEIAHIGPFQSVCAKVTTATGVKRHFGFAMHHPGAEQRPEECTQSVIPDFPFGPESHVLRHEVDAYMLHAAIRHGARYMSGVDVRGIRIDERGAVLSAADGQEIHAEFVVDAGGANSPLARLLQLREEPARFLTHSRSVFTHMVGVKAYDDVAPAPGNAAMPRWWHEGTLHHLLDEGWMWIIAFDNHRYSTSPLCSVGLQLDSRRFPAGRDPGQEFAEVVRRYPTIARQFADAKPVRAWTAAPRLQYSSTRSTGYRWMLLAHAYGFVDPLFSRGITNTMESIHSFVPRFLAALKDGDMSAERFEDINVQQRDMFDNNDELVRHSYMTFQHFQLWNAWNRVWTLGIFYGGGRLVRAYNKFRESGDLKHFDALDTPHNMRSLAPTLPGYEALFQESTALIRDVNEGRAQPDEVAAALFQRLRECPWAPPAFRLGDPDAILTDFRFGNLNKVIRWGYTGAPPIIRENFFDFSPLPAMREFVERLRSPHLLLWKGELSVVNRQASP